jgi:hypothetical protein
MEGKVAHTLIFLSKTREIEGTARPRMGAKEKKEKLDSVS